MKKINYGSVIHSNLRRFMADPENLAVKIGVPLITGAYPDKTGRGLIAEAMVLWTGINPSSAFYEKLEDRLRKKKDFDWAQYNTARDAQVRLLSSRLASIEDTSANAWVRAVCRFMLLPKDVVRKWLWHENVDFQSCEGFLRRLTKEQHVSLKLHYDLVKKGTPASELPCFADGVLNKVWNFFGITAKEEPNRMATKTAIAHDFLGMGMGFALYPNANEDSKADQKLASQFLAKKQDRGQFEVNKEHGGLYWFLFRALRSNPLYREDKHVELGRWVCPGFWFTMIMWGILTLVSPASLLVATGLYVLKGVTSGVLFGLGAILPVVVTLVWVKKLCNKEYDDEYLKWLMVVSGCYLVIIFGHEILLHAKGYWSVPTGMLCIFLLVPYCLKKDTFAFWQAPILGKLLPLVFLSAGAWDIHVHSDFWQDCGGFFWWLAQYFWSFFQAIANFFYEARYTIMWWTIGIASYSTVAYGLFFLSSWALEKFDELIEKGDRRAYSYERWVYGGVVAIASTIFLVGVRLTSPDGGFGLLHLVVVSLPFLIFLVVRAIHRVDSVINDKVVQTALMYQAISKDDREAIQASISRNNFWVDITHAVARANVLNSVFHKLYYRKGINWVLAVIRSVKNDTELANVEKFASSELYYQLSVRVVDPEVLRLILSGASDDVLREAIAKAEEKWSGIPRKQIEPSIREKLADWLVEWLNSKAGPFLVTCFMFATWPIRVLWKGICDLYDLWEAFNEQCPQSPPQDRATAQ